MPHHAMDLDMPWVVTVAVYLAAQGTRSVARNSKPRGRLTRESAAAEAGERPQLREPRERIHCSRPEEVVLVAAAAAVASYRCLFLTSQSLSAHWRWSAPPCL